MTKRSLIILIILAIVLTISSIMIIRKTHKSYLHSEQAIGALVFPNFKLDKIKSIKIVKPDKTTVTLKKNQNRWVVKNLYDYPANNELLSSLLEETANLKAIQNIQITPKAYQKLELTLSKPKNTQKGTEIRFSNNKGKVLYSLIIGKQRVEKDLKKRSELTVGRYIKVPYRAEIYLTDELFNSINLNANDWLFDRNISINNIKEVELSKDSKVEWVIQRNNNKEEFNIKGISKYTDINRNKIKSIINSLNNLKFNTIADDNMKEKETGLNNPVCLNIQTFSGIKYELRIGNMVNNLRYVKYTMLPPSSEALTEDKKILESLSNKWIYLIDINRLDPLLSSKESILTPENYKSVPTNTYSQPIS